MTTSHRFGSVPDLSAKRSRRYREWKIVRVAVLLEARMNHPNVTCHAHVEVPTATVGGRGQKGKRVLQHHDGRHGERERGDVARTQQDVGGAAPDDHGKDGLLPSQSGVVSRSPTRVHAHPVAVLRPEDVDVPRVS